MKACSVHRQYTMERVEWSVYKQNTVERAEKTQCVVYIDRILWSVYKQDTVERVERTHLWSVYGRDL